MPTDEKKKKKKKNGEIKTKPVRAEVKINMCWK